MIKGASIIGSDGDAVQFRGGALEKSTIHYTYDMKKRQASRRKHHYIYKTTCLITERYYIGMHSTDYLDDGYLGSGKRLGYSIKKHGRKNHKREILEFLPDRKSLREREEQIVSEDCLRNDDCLNLRKGGEGWNSDSASEAGKRAWEIEKNRDVMLKNLEKGVLFAKASGLFSGKMLNWKGRKHKPETIEKMKRSHALNKSLREKNGSFGTIWIRNESKKQSKRIKKEKLNEYLAVGWIVGRKIKW